VGPFFAIGLDHLCSNHVPMDVSGEAITVRGRLLDVDGIGIPDACLEFWQPNSHDHDSVDGADGFTRVATDIEGEFHFKTRKPRQSAYDDTSMQAPHLLVLIFMRGLLRNLVTRVYFSGEAGNETDPVLRLVPAERRHTLIAQAEPANSAEFLWTVRTCSTLETADSETVFFEW
jgi:protocatechuate 3,4-dioxygenase alpha subunit